MADPRVIEPGERVALGVFGTTFSGYSPCVFDVGANVGDYISEVLKVFPDAAIYAFEPQPEAMDELHDRFPWVHTEEYVISNIDDAVVTMKRDRAKSYHASLHRVMDPALGIFKQTIRVQSRRLDTYCKDNDIVRINWLKVDVEGHEMAVLKGAGSMLGPDIEVVQFEFGPHAALARFRFYDLWELLSWRGYRIYRQYNDRLEQLYGYSEEHEQPEPLRNYLAVNISANWWWARV